MKRSFKIAARYSEKNDLTITRRHCIQFLRAIPDNAAQLVFTSPPYNLGKVYEPRTTIDEYVSFQDDVIAECARIVRPGGSICWQVGTYVAERGDLFPLDILLYGLFAKQPSFRLRNRVIWYFEHGEHCRNRLSGRHECILWWSKGDDYLFNLDAIRVPQKYPGKRSYRGPNRGRPSGNPRGKNPGDVWSIPNVKGNHVEKTSHPCQFPIALAEYFVLALTNTHDLVVDPFLGSGTTAIASLRNCRRAAGSDINPEYIEIARGRVRSLERGHLPYRDRAKSIYVPLPNSPLTVPPEHFVEGNGGRAHHFSSARKTLRADSNLYVSSSR